MKVERVEYFINKGLFTASDEFKQILDDIELGIAGVTWHEEKRFVINPTDKANGVNPIKRKFIAYLSSKGWQPEISMSLVTGMNPGPIDAIKDTKYGRFAVEWETGNVSSSHRALNKIALGIIQKQLIGGMLVLPIRGLSRYLTDRIGNYEEIAPYFVLYNSLNIDEGVMGVFAVNYDDVSSEASLIPKGKDGNARK